VRLQDALRAEHALIVQLMGHGYRIGGSAVGQMEGISRQDMRHFKWIAELVVRLGGTPTLERGPIQMEAAAPHVWLAADVSLVEDRLAACKAHMDLLDAHAAEGPEAEIRQLLERIAADKMYHREKLLGMLVDWQTREPQATASEAAAGEAAASNDVDEATQGFLQFAIGHEYEVVLQYLHHAFLLEDQWASRQLEDVAIEEMRHLGWLSETLIERGGCPFWEAKRLELDDDAIRMLELDQQREIEVEADYAQMTAAMSDPDIRRLFDRIGSHESYHAKNLGRLIERLKGQRSDAPPLIAALMPSLPPPAVTPSAAAPGAAPQPSRSSCPYTVGSLFGQPQS
jgi:bacterioferritin